MNDVSSTQTITAAPSVPQPSRVALAWLILPLAVLALAITWLVTANPLRTFDNGPSKTSPSKGRSFRRMASRSSFARAGQSR